MTQARTVQAIYGCVVLGLVCCLNASAAFAQGVKAFPTAEGFGAGAVGGRGGAVYHVTNLNDSGSGSLRYGIQNASGPTTIVFDVGGTIALQSDLIIDKSYLTIAGQTAPGDGIALVGGQVRISADHVISRYLRCRYGSTAYDQDSLHVSESNNVILDHISASWGTDETLSVSESNYVTVQNCIVGEALNTYDHAYGSLVRGYVYDGNSGGYTFARNLWTCNTNRNPGFGSGYSEGQLLELDLVNNVVHNWESQPSHDADSLNDMHVNYVGNTVIAGPDTREDAEQQNDPAVDNVMVLINSDVGDLHVYESGNMVDYDKDGMHDPQPTIYNNSFRDWSPYADLIVEPNRYDFPQVTTLSAQAAYKNVLARVGASLSRDSADGRMIGDVIDREGAIVPNNENLVFPTLTGGTAPTDTDQDGMPDSWETNLKLNPSDAADGSHVARNGYTNLENYLNNLAIHSEPWYGPGGASNWYDANWNDSSGTSEWVEDSRACFAQTSGGPWTITVNGAPCVGGISFSQNGYTLTDGTLKLSVGGVDVGNDDSTINSVIAGSDGLWKTGTGQLTLGGANTFTGGVLIGDGTLKINNGQALGDSGNAVTVLSGGTLQLASGTEFPGTMALYLNGTGAYENGALCSYSYNTWNGSVILQSASSINVATHLLTIDGDISGNYALTKVGAGTLKIRGTNTYGATTISAGTLIIGDYGNTTGSLGTGNVVNNGTLDFRRPNAYTANNAISGSGSLTQSGAGTLTLTGSNTYSGVTTISAGTLQIGAGGATGTLGSGAVTNNSALVFNRSNAYSVSNAISGSGSLTKSGAGTLTLSGANTYTGGTTIDAGNLRFGTVASCIPSTGQVTINSGGALVAAGPNSTYNYATPQGWLSSGKINAASTGALALAANNTAAISMGSYANLSIGAAGTYTCSGTITPAGNVYRLGGGGGTLTVSSRLTGTNALTVNGNVTLSYNSSNKNTYSGGTTIYAGDLYFRYANSLPTNGPITINSGGALVAAGAYSSPQNWLNSGRINTASDGALALLSTSSASINMAGPYYNYANLSLGMDAASGTYSGTLTPSGDTYRLGGGKGVLTVSSALSGARNLAINGNTTLVGTNTFTGATTVNSGILRLNGSGSIGSTNGITLNAGGTLLQNSSAIFDRTITFNGGTLGGTGTYNKGLTVGNGHLAPGDGGVGTFSTDDNLYLDPSSILDYDFGITAGISDLFTCTRAGYGLTLDGTINIGCSGSLSAGSYTIFSGFTNIIDNGLEFGSVPGGHSYSYHIDDGTGSVIVTAAPEPGTLILALTALLGILAYAWQRRQ